VLLLVGGFTAMKKKPTPLDPNMVQTYKAVQILSKQFKK
jgi:hypothetical protein